MHLLINRNPKENRRIKLDYCIRNKMAAHTSVQDNREPNHCVCQWNHLSTWIICLSCVHERKQVKMEIKWPGERVREEFYFFPCCTAPRAERSWHLRFNYLCGTWPSIQICLYSLSYFSFSGCKIFRDAVFVRVHAERVDGLCGILLWHRSADI